MSTKVSHTVEFRPMRWVGIAAIACLMAFFFGLAEATPVHSVPLPTSCTSSLK
jgi:hypothetical protein